MIIAIDLRPLMGGNTSGVEIYTRNLLHHLFSNAPENTYILYLNARKKEASLLKEFQKKGVKIVHTRYPNKIFNFLLVFLRWPKLDQLIQRKTGVKPDIFFTPDLRPSPVSKKTKKVTVVHDLAFHHFPHFFSWRTKLWYALINPKKEICESSSIIAVSEFTKKDLIETYGIDPFKITVVYEGIDQEFGGDITQKQKEKISEKYGLPKEYFLFLSTLEPRKNIRRLISAYKKFKKKNPGISLVIGGKGNHRIFSKTTLPQENDIIFPGFIEEKDKAAVYAMAKAFIYPSIFEGFGLPLLEAMKCKTPIIASNVSSIPEVTDGTNAAILVDPDSTEEIDEAMEKMLNPQTRKALRSQMAEQINKFSWDKCAAETLITFFLS